MRSDLSEVSWRTSSYSTPNGDCVAVGYIQTGDVAVRDSKNPNGGALIFSPGTWDAFLAVTRGGELDRP